MVKKVSPPPVNHEYELFPWKAWVALRVVTIIIVSGAFVAAITSAVHVANGQSDDIIKQRDAALRITPENLQKTSDGISKAYSTLPSDIPLTYSDAKINCTDVTEGKSRIICFKNGAYAKLRVKPAAGDGLEAADTITGIIASANWTQQIYTIIKKDGSTINRNASDGNDIASIRISYKSGTVDGKQYCLGLVYWKNAVLHWKGSVQDCAQHIGAQP